MRQDKRLFDFCFMPWLDLGWEVRIGPVSFLPIGHISEPDAKQLMDKVCACYVDEIGQPVQTAVICRLDGNADFSEMSSADVAVIRQAADALCFASSFEMARLRLGESHMHLDWNAAQAQLIRHCTRSSSMHFSCGTTVNCSYEKHRFHRPSELSWTGPNLNRVMLDALSALWHPSVDSKLRERVLRCIEWVRLAHDDSGAVTELSKIVMMGTAFETLLDVGQVSPIKWPLMAKMDALCRTCYSTTKIFAKPGRSESVKYSQMASWMHDLYGLRNCIVHGDTVGCEQLYIESPTESVGGPIPHLLVADVVIAHCIYMLLCEAQVVGDDCRARSQLQIDTGCTVPIEELVRQTVLYELGLNGVHKKLCWLGDSEEEDA